MPIRLAQWSDLPIMARVLAASFGPDKLFQVLFPRQHEYPEDFERAFRYSLQAAWWDYSQVLLVSYDNNANIDANANDESSELLPLLATSRSGQRSELITGMSQWQRAGPSPRTASIWPRTSWLSRFLGHLDPRRLVLPLLKLRNRVLYFFSPCKASAPSTPSDPDPLLYTNFLSRLAPYARHLLDWSGPTSAKPWRSEHWSLEILAVHPSYQGKGVGRELVAWGFEEARKEEVPCVVVAAKGKERFYQRCGFEELVGWSTRDVEGVEGRNPLGSRGVEGGAVLWSHVKEDGDAVKDVEV